MKIAYGLDLSGYSGGKSGLAKAALDESGGFSITCFRTHPFSQKVKGRDSLASQTQSELTLLCSCRPLFIDIPIDLQRLPAVPDPHFAWQLTKRSVDFAFSALPPLADRIGAPVARLSHLLHGDLTRLGIDLFETYPAASLIPMLGTVPSYKGQSVERQDGAWIGDDGLSEILQRLRVEADDGVVLNDDHFDAAICALTGVLPEEWLLYGASLEEAIRLRMEKKVRKQDRAAIVAVPPKGYVLVQKQLSEVPLRFHFEDRFLLNDEATSVGVAT